VTILTIVCCSPRLPRHPRSHYGLALRAMHDSEDATRVVGVNNTLLKGLMLLVSAFMCGVVRRLQRPLHQLPRAGLRLQRQLGHDSDRRRHLRRLPHHRRAGGRRGGGLSVRPTRLQGSLMPTGHQLVLGGLLVAMIIFSPTGCGLCCASQGGKTMLSLNNVTRSASAA
jgi:branched-chain amino acid transport system permease protein